MTQPLTDRQRKLIHDLALEARALLTQEARELLEGTFGLYADGRLDPADKLPLVQSDPDIGETYRRLAQFLEDEERAGLDRVEAVEKLVKEVAFTHLNRLVAFKMMEARNLIRGTLDKGTESNAFKFYLADPEHADDLARYEKGDVDGAYRYFLLWQCGQVAQEVRVLFDPDTLPSCLFPRPRALAALLKMLNQAELAQAWHADETIGWIYQYFNEQEKAEVFERLYRQKKKIRRQDIPAATQLFTPHWIVRFLVHNTLGRLWVEMHPDTRLLDGGVLDYLVPLENTEDVKREDVKHVRPVKEITLLDPACGTMHFGLVAFDLLAAMYGEEMERAGEPGWPETPSVAEPGDIPASIVKSNLFGIDIDLRAVQLSALALYLKAKSLNPQAGIADSNLACADVLPLNGARLGTFLRQVHFTQPIYERLIRSLWQRLRDVGQLGSLLRLEREMGEMIAQERRRFEKEPLFVGLAGKYEREAAEEEFWGIISAQMVQGLDEFARQQAAAGTDQTFFSGEAVKGLRLLDLMLRRYDVVVTNPPYSTKRNLNSTLADHLDSDYPDAKGDLYTAFIQRCGEWVTERGRLGMITQQSFMFLSSYEKLRATLRERFAIETMAHTGPRAFAEISGEVVNTTVFALRAEADTKRRENSVGTYFRLVNAPEGDGKRQAFEQALAALRHQDKPCSVGILAYGSLQEDPGAEISLVVDHVVGRVTTPFEVEYARKSRNRCGAPTLVPVAPGKGSRVQAQIIVLLAEIDAQTAKNMLYRRETNRVGQMDVSYQEPEKPNANTVLIEIATVPEAEEVGTIVYTHIADSIFEISDDDVAMESKAQVLARLAIESVTPETFGAARDGIRYLADAIRHGIRTPLTEAYRDAILEKAREMTGKEMADLETARREIARKKRFIPQEEA